MAKHHNFKSIHIGNLIQQSVEEQQIELSRICNFLNCKEDEILNMYHQDSLDTNVLLRWSKLLKYDFFRMYSQHLILYSPAALLKKKKEIGLPSFRKNIYTKEIKDFILELI